MNRIKLNKLAMEAKANATPENKIAYAKAYAEYHELEYVEPELDDDSEDEIDEKKSDDLDNELSDQETDETTAEEETPEADKSTDS